jgi:iron(III) transport system substrate-binding protein
MSTQALPIGRRRFLVLVGISGAAALLQACSSSAPPASAPAPPAATAAPAQASAAAPSSDWDKVVAGAKSEGSVTVNTFPGSANQQALAEFNKAYPEIKLEQTTLVSSGLAPKILQERQAGLYTWDVIHQPTTTSLQVLKPAGVLDPIKPAIVRPDVIDDAAWRDGFAAGFNLTSDGQLCYQSTLVRSQNLMIDTEQVGADEVQSAQDLLNPKWKGKIVCTDTRISGSTFFPFTLARLKYGDDWMKRFFEEQEPVIINDGAQIAQLLAHGNYPLAIGAIWTVLQDFQKQGIATSIKQVVLPDIDAAGPSTNGTLWLVNKAPHPNAARVYLNWFLSKEGQEAWTSTTIDNSRRLDVAPKDAATVVPAGLVLPDLNEEKYLPDVAKTQELAKQLIK